MITEQTLEKLDRALEDLNRLYYQTLGLNESESYELKHSIELLLHIQQDIMLHLHNIK